MDGHISMMDLPQGRILSVQDRDSTKLLQEQITTSEWQTRPRQAKWGVNWRAPFKMLGLLVSGVGLALGHYFYFHSLEGTIVIPSKGLYDLHDQEWHARFGTAIAFLVKTCFAAAVAIAYKQVAWLNMRSKAHSVSGLDSMFSGTTDLLAYLSLDFTLHAKFAALIAGVTWLMPLSALVAQATLTVIPSTNVANEAKLVPALDFNSPNFLANGLDDGIAPILSRISSATIAIPAVLPMDAVYPNSTYDLSFKGPGLNCHNATDNTTISAIDAGTQVYGLVVYMAKLDPNSTNTLWFKFNDERLVCDLQNNTYRIHVSSTDSTTEILHDPSNTWDELDYNDLGFPQNNYGAYMEVLARLFVGTIDLYAVGPAGQTASSGYSSITSNSTSVASTALESLIVDAANDALAGMSESGDYETSPTDVTVSAADRALARNLTFELLVEELSYNITLSLFSDRRYWSKEGVRTIVTTFTAVNVYYFNAWNLVLSYAIAFVISLFCVLVGLRAMFVNGVSHSMSFSTIVAVTRNSTLDNLLVGNSLGAEPMSKDVMAKKLMFGVLRHDLQRDKPGMNSEIDHASFGLCDEVVRIRRGHAIS